VRVVSVYRALQSHCVCIIGTQYKHLSCSCNVFSLYRALQSHFAGVAPVVFHFSTKNKKLNTVNFHPNVRSQEQKSSSKKNTGWIVTFFLECEWHARVTRSSERLQLIGNRLQLIGNRVRLIGNRLQQRVTRGGTWQKSYSEEVYECVE